MAITFTTAEQFITWVESQKRFTPKVNLDKIYYWANLLGNPQLRFKSIHVTGTNGKGSTVAYLNQMLSMAGLKVATFTSPYLYRFNERICYNQAMISDQDLLFYANKITSLYADDKSEIHPYDYPSFFEFITLLAFCYFADQPDLDMAIIEVGIGGLLDTTNIITPIASIITNVSFDHMAILGSTLPEILDQKLGIVKPNIPLITAISSTELIKQIKLKTQLTNSPLYLPLLNDYQINYLGIDQTIFTSDQFGQIKLQLLGAHQIENALVALTTLQVINDQLYNNRSFEEVLPIYKKGLAMTKWPGRFEVVNHHPLIILDGAHNEDGIKRCCQLIKALPYQSVRCVFACSNDKEKNTMISLLEPLCQELIFTTFTYKRHSDALLLYQSSQHHNKLLMVDFNEILEHINNKYYQLTIFIGSLYFISEINPIITKFYQDYK